MDGYLTGEVVESVRAILDDAEMRREMVEHNLELAKHYFSKDVLEYHLGHLISNIDTLGHNGA